MWVLHLSIHGVVNMIFPSYITTIHTPNKMSECAHDKMSDASTVTNEGILFAPSLVENWLLSRAVAPFSLGRF
jgi:hypothetical protein